MLLTLLFVVFVYLFAVESFTAFLYPDPQEVALYFKAAELPGRLFDMMIGAATLVIAKRGSIIIVSGLWSRASPTAGASRAIEKPASSRRWRQGTRIVSLASGSSPVRCRTIS